MRILSVNRDRVREPELMSRRARRLTGKTWEESVLTSLTGILHLFRYFSFLCARDALQHYESADRSHTKRILGPSRGPASILIIPV